MAERVRRRVPPVPPAPIVPPPGAPIPKGRFARLRARLAGIRRGVHIGPGVVLGPRVVFEVRGGGRVRIGAGAAIGARSRFHVDGGTVVIGPGAVLGEGCVVRAHASAVVGTGARLADHVVLLDHAPAHDAPYLDVEPRTAPVAVGDRARLGQGVVVEPGASVPAGTDVGPNVVVGA